MIMCAAPLCARSLKFGSWRGSIGSIPGVPIMRARLLIPAAAATALLSLAAAVSAQNPAPTMPQTPAGLWQAVDDDTKQPTGWFLIAIHDGVYSGIIARMFLKPGEDPNAVCTQ